MDAAARSLLQKLEGIRVADGSPSDHDLRPDQVASESSYNYAGSQYHECSRREMTLDGVGQLAWTSTRKRLFLVLFHKGDPFAMSDTKEPVVHPNPEKDPSDWVTGDEPMTGPQMSYLKTLCQEAGEQFDEKLTKAQASERIEELQAKTGRGQNA